MLYEILLSLLGFPGEVVVDTGSTYSLRRGIDYLTKAEQDQINRIVPLGELKSRYSTLFHYEIILILM
jgi:hypothetical protein